MNAFVAYTIIGIVTGAGYAIAATGFVLTYTTSRIFNVAHGAMAMAAAFVYYDLAFRHGMPRLLALLLVVGVIAPLFGVLIERFIMRNLTDSPVNISLVVTIGLFVLLYGLIQKVYPPTEIGPVKPLLSSVHVGIAGQTIDGNAMLKVLLAMAVALAFYLFFKRTRTGIAMRAVVDNRSLLALHGARPSVMSALSWAIGVGLAALAGILLSASSDQGLDYLTLTLLVITAYAAAILGRLENLPLTFLGALILGLGTSYATGYLPTSTVYNGLKVGLPAIFLFLVLVLLPRAPLRVGQIRGIVSVPVPSARKTLISAAVFFIAMVALTPSLSDSRSDNLGLAFVYGAIMLSLVLLTGYGGYLNLAPVTFAGIGALTVAKLDSSSPLALALGGLIAGVIGAMLGLLAIRLGALYLAIATLAFAELMDYVVFQSNWGFAYGSAKTVKRLDLFGYHVSSEHAYFLFSVVLFLAFGIFVLWLRRGRYGRLLIALRDSPAACGTLGLNLTFTRVGVFAMSATMAGLAGAVYAGLLESVGAVQFNVLQNLPVVLMAVVGGVTSVSGAALGGILLVILTKSTLSIFGVPLNSITGIIIGAAAILLGRNPNGLISYVFKFGRWVQNQVTGESPASPTAGVRTEPEFTGREEVSVGGSL